MTSLASPLPATDRPWKRATLWLLFLAPFFYLTYGTANWLASQRTGVGSFVYGAKRLLTAQIVAVAFFVLIPLRFTFEKPGLPGGLAGFLFEALGAFDKPFNQAPSLHVALLVILWPFYTRHVPRWARMPFHIWFALIGVSVLTTYQHHFIDVPTGALLGLFCLWLWPDESASPLSGARFASDPKRRTLAMRYAAGAAMLSALAIWLGGFGWLLFWPALSLGFVAMSYGLVGAPAFQKRADGNMSLAAQLMLSPYLLGAFVNSRLWTRNDPKSAEVADGVHIGRLPTRSALSQTDGTAFATIVDLSAELPRLSAAAAYHALPVLDLTVPSESVLFAAAESIESARGRGPVLVCCRSAAAVACWGLRSGRHASLDEAVNAIRRVRPRIILDDATQTAILAAARIRSNSPR